MEFSKWLNHEGIPQNPGYAWTKEVSSKAVKQSVMSAEKAFKRFFKGKSDVKMYFVKTDSRVIISCERHRIKIPTLEWGEDKGKGIFPNESRNVRKLEKKLKREQRRLSRKYGSNKRHSTKKGEATRQNIQKQQLKVQRLHQRLDNIRTNHINQTINKMVKTKPSYIAIEDLNVSGMMKNRHLSKAVVSQKFYEFRTKLEAKCRERGIELRMVDRWYPSSGMCHKCKTIKADLKLSDRIYRCECGYYVDRDYNASLNLRDAKTYKIA